MSVAYSDPYSDQGDDENDDKRLYQTPCARHVANVCSNDNPSFPKISRVDFLVPPISHTGMTWLVGAGRSRTRIQDNDPRACAFVWNTFSKLPCAKLPPRSFLFLRTLLLLWAWQPGAGGKGTGAPSPARPARTAPSPLAALLHLAARVTISSWCCVHRTPRTRVTPTNKPSHSPKDVSHLPYQASPLKCRFRSLAQIPRPTQITHAHSQNPSPSAPVCAHTHNTPVTRRRFHPVPQNTATCTPNPFRLLLREPLSGESPAFREAQVTDGAAGFVSTLNTRLCSSWPLLRGKNPASKQNK